jgi:hypothetical protein
MPSLPPRWDWGSFIVYGLACLFLGLLTGLFAIPGIVPVLGGAALGLWAARKSWFERDGNPPPHRRF